MTEKKRRESLWIPRVINSLRRIASKISKKEVELEKGFPPRTDGKTIWLDVDYYQDCSEQEAIDYSIIDAAHEAMHIAITDFGYFYLFQKNNSSYPYLASDLFNIIEDFRINSALLNKYQLLRPLFVNDLAYSLAKRPSPNQLESRLDKFVEAYLQALLFGVIKEPLNDEELSKLIELALSYSRIVLGKTCAYTYFASEKVLELIINNFTLEKDYKINLPICCGGKINEQPIPEGNKEPEIVKAIEDNFEPTYQPKKENFHPKFISTHSAHNEEKENKIEITKGNVESSPIKIEHLDQILDDLQKELNEFYEQKEEQTKDEKREQITRKKIHHEKKENNVEENVIPKDEADMDLKPNQTKTDKVENATNVTQQSCDKKVDRPYLKQESDSGASDMTNGDHNAAKSISESFSRRGGSDSTSGFYDYEFESNISKDYQHFIIPLRRVINKLTYQMIQLKMKKKTAKHQDRGKRVDKNAYIKQLGMKKQSKVFENGVRSSTKIASLILLDISASMESLILKAKQSLAIMAEVMNNINADFALYAFSTKIYKIKSFNEKWGSKQKNVLLNLTAQGGTPTGTKMMELLEVFNKIAKKKKSLILITDGLPDSEEKVRKALLQYSKASIMVFCISIDVDVRHIFKENYVRIEKIDELIQVFFKKYAKNYIY